MNQAMVYVYIPVGVGIMHKVDRGRTPNHLSESRWRRPVAAAAMLALAGVVGGSGSVLARGGEQTGSHPADSHAEPVATASHSPGSTIDYAKMVARVAKMPIPDAVKKAARDVNGVMVDPPYSFQTRISHFHPCIRAASASWMLGFTTSQSCWYSVIWSIRLLWCFRIQVSKDNPMWFLCARPALA